jgi:hypothetical protein
LDARAAPAVEDLEGDLTGDADWRLGRLSDWLVAFARPVVSLIRVITAWERPVVETLRRLRLVASISLSTASPF